MPAQKTPRERDSVRAEVAKLTHGRVPRDLRRRQVLAVAGELFVERGFADASMDELARRVGVSKPVIYELVGSKEQLFGELAAREATALTRTVAEAVEGRRDDTPRAQLHAGALAFFRFVRARHEVWDRMLTPDAAVSDQLAAARRVHARSVSTLLAKCATDLAKNTDPLMLDASGHAISGVFEALVYWWKEHPRVTEETLAALATTLVADGVRGLPKAAPKKTPS